jgi:hypothetical protein
MPHVKQLVRGLLIGIAALTMMGTAFSASVRAQDTAPALLSAFFGLDNALPFGANGICIGARGQDGMPVIFSHEIDAATLDAADFAVITASGAINTPFCVSLEPAVDAGEARTALLIGELGDAQSDPPIRVEMVGEVLTMDGASFVGAAIAVTPLDAGPNLVIAELVPPRDWHLDRPADRQAGDGCPSAGTLQVVRATWAGGVTIAGGEEAGDAQRARYRVTVQDADGTTRAVTPFALADIGDGDNNHALCLDTLATPISVAFPAGHLFDPNADAPNPDTEIGVEISADSRPNTYHDVRYCEIVVTYRQSLTLRTEIWNTLGLNDCPADAWAALDGAALGVERGAVNLALNGPRHWVLDEIMALGGVTASGERATFDTIEMELRAILETSVRGDLVGERLYTPNTVQRDTRYVFYERLYTLTDPDGNLYVMQSYAQIIDPALTLADLATLGERLSVPEGWTYAVIELDAPFILLSGGETTIVQDDLLNTYQRVRPEAAVGLQRAS